MEVTWTHLAETIDPGDTQMTLKQPVDWKVGDQIVIAATGHRHSQRENEFLTITGRHGPFRDINLKEEYDE